LYGRLRAGATGLLKGRRATTHWACTDLLPLVGATCEKARIVRDGAIFTAGGVSPCIDFGFRIVAEIAGADVAQAIQLAIEYDPAPPFDSGHPDKAPESAIALKTARNEKARVGVRDGLRRLGMI
jgi:cyclohexyl-isocyanide hydratase